MSKVGKFVAVVTFAITPGQRGVSTQHYDFNCNIPVEKGDIVAVECTTGMQLCRVVGVKQDSSAVKDHAWVVDIVDVASHKQRKELMAQAEQLRTQLLKRENEIGELSRFAQLAKVDPTAAELYKQLQEAQQAIAATTR